MKIGLDDEGRTWLQQ